METAGQNRDRRAGDPDRRKFPEALTLALQLGYLITLPIIVLALLGRYLDKNWQTSPLFLLIGIFSAIAVTTKLVHGKVKKLTNSQTTIAESGPPQKT